ncbi:MAG: DUF1127 domain-containing protein [Pseudomonadota bacterium]
MAYYNDVVTSGASARSVVSYFKSLTRAFADWNTRRVTVDQLSKLNLRDLEDIGLTRADVDAITRRF